MLPSASASGARASRRSTAALATQINAMAQPRPCFLRLANGGHYLPHAVPVQRGTPQAGRNAGRTDARTARERGYKPRPREPHPPRQSAVTGDDPSRAGFAICNVNGDRCQGLVTAAATTGRWTASLSSSSCFLVMLPRRGRVTVLPAPLATAAAALPASASRRARAWPPSRRRRAYQHRAWRRSRRA